MKKQPTEELVKAAADGARWAKAYLMRWSTLELPRQVDVALLSEIMSDALLNGKTEEHEYGDLQVGGAYPVVYCGKCDNVDKCTCSQAEAISFETRKHAAVADFYRDFHMLHLDSQCRAIERMIEAARGSKFLQFATGEVFDHLIAHGGMQPFEMRLLWAQYRRVLPSERGRTQIRKERWKGMVVTMMQVLTGQGLLPVNLLTGQEFNLPVHRSEQRSRNTDPNLARKLNRLNACYIVSSLCQKKFPANKAFFDENSIRRIWYELPPEERLT